MTTLTLFCNSNEIAINNKPSSWCVEQTAKGTEVYHRVTGRTLPLPTNRYALSCDKPLSGRPGRADFERDVIAALGL